MPKIAMRTHSARVGREGDEAGAASIETGSPGRGGGGGGAGGGPARVAAGESAVALRGCVFGSVAMGGLSFLSLIVLPEYYGKI